MTSKLSALILTITLVSGPAFSWEGIELESGNSVEIEKGTLVRTGETIDYFDWDEGEYKTVTIDDISRDGDTVSIEATDDETGESLSLEMDDE